MIGETIYTKDSEGQAQPTNLSCLDGKYVGIYFWRPESLPCREFTEHLKNVYKHYKDERSKFEILFLISETLMYKVYNDTMPWAGIVCAGQRRSALTAKFKITTVPSMMIISPERKVIATNARLAILERPKDFPWTGAVDDEVIRGGKVNNAVVIVVFIVVILSFIFGYFYFAKLHEESMEYRIREAAAEAERLLEAQKLFGDGFSSGVSSSIEPPQGLGRDGEL
ncbi:hypothetical protein CEUSTIGMA_g9042.t1 [Chlamydomonas eustigma]|uniref:Thioredoxin-like fold domain-containing protein n=1 Tax=Chlamydomonas eustigma TaxID=1157962 RepID=A0A250XEV0_9CHLO|nr:hypothetical protein CEUSTIGMA_g9042.t1 [Chlamydomonas eustigma]|eukprot:GAX81614.1 hypothetical protein CEUSTIGMA_g9042.t1 [Chlamydomonas eustigma]